MLGRNAVLPDLPGLTLVGSRALEPARPVIDGRKAVISLAVYSRPYNSSSSAIHWQSVMSRLRPGTLRMCAALHTHTPIPAPASAW
jgi:hypothetical protein